MTIQIRKVASTNDLYFVDFGPRVRFSADAESLRELARAISYPPEAKPSPLPNTPQEERINERYANAVYECSHCGEKSTLPHPCLQTLDYEPDIEGYHEKE